ncbi:sialate O-acetylesterase [Mangrovibacterium sp.]|uniref:sialate O-acetylesterase n=1 Tax=Mangrovibacterium sp. TaxID=1961364 RepID=UPI003566833E
MKRRGLLLAVFLLLVAQVFAGNLRLGSPFTEHMVLQRDQPIQVWGEAVPGSSVSVKLGNYIATAPTNSVGEWKATLPKQKAGGPFSFSVISGDESLAFTDVMIGDVWICSGQSNMQMGFKGIPEVAELEAKAKNIRTFKFKRTVAFEEQKYIDGQWVDEVPESAVAFSFAYFLEAEADVPVGIILTCWGSSSIEGWMPRDMTEKLPHFKKIMAEFDADEVKKAKIDSILAVEQRSTPGDILLRTQPNIIYNAMMKPFAPYACRGIVWYQGEANAKNIDDMLQYGETLPLWIERMRNEWNQPDLHFLGVMLPGYGNQLQPLELTDSLMESPEALSWAWMRESQCKALELPNTAIATTIDLGDKTNIHPKDKLPVGQRLALLAGKSTLGYKGLSDGPLLKKVSIKRNSIVIAYENAKGLKTTDGDLPKAFWMAGVSGKWVRATATIKGEKVVLTSSELTAPTYVRYAFSAMPNVNLVNAAGLPARPFRTDKFKAE